MGEWLMKQREESAAPAERADGGGTGGSAQHLHHHPAPSLFAVPYKMPVSSYSSIMHLLQGSWLVMRSICCRQSAAVTRGPPRSVVYYLF